LNSARTRRASAIFSAFAILCFTLAACSSSSTTSSTTAPASTTPASTTPTGTTPSGTASSSATAAALPPPQTGLPNPLPYDASLYNQLPASIQSSKVVVMAQAIQAPYYQTEGSTQSGIAVDVNTYLSDLLGVKFENLNAPSIAAADLDISGGRAQAFFGPSLDTLQLEHQGENYIDWNSVTQGLLYAKGDKITSELSFCGHVIATEATVPTEAYLSSLSAACKAHGLAAETSAYYPGIPQLVTAVQDGRAYASDFSDTSALYDAKQQPSVFGAFVVPAADSAPLLGLGMAVGTNTGTLTNVLATALGMLDKAGILSADFNYWGLPPSSGALETTVHVNDYELNAGLGKAVCCTLSSS
jgi:ABC-type amino acid transport substrate-binding protein